MFPFHTRCPRLGGERGEREELVREFLAFDTSVSDFDDGFILFLLFFFF